MMAKLVTAGVCALALTFGLAGCGADATATSSTAEQAQATDATSDDADAAATDDSADAAATSSKEVAEKGDTVQVHYRGTLEDGTQFDSSYDRGTPLEFVVGAGQMISGFDAAVEGMKVGETKTVTLQPSEAYGERNEELVMEFDRTEVPDPANVKVGDTLALQTSSGGTATCTVTEVTPTTVTVDANPQLAGKALTFDIELVSVN